MTVLDRAFSSLEIKSVSDETRTVEGWATTPKLDRQGDIVDWQGLTFGNSIKLLLYHDSTLPVGNVKFGTATKRGLPFTAFIPNVIEPGIVKDRVDEAWHSVKYNLIAAVSIGFRVLDDAIERIDTGYKFLKTEILELSLVPVPANDQAVITSFKSMDAAAITRIKQFETDASAATGQTKRQSDVPPGATGKSTSTKPVKLLPKEGTKMKSNIAEQISAFEATRQAKSAEMDKIMDGAAEKGETLDAEQKEIYDTLVSETKEIDEHLGRLREREKNALVTAKAVNAIDVESGNRSRQTGTSTIQVKQNAPKGTGFIRLLSARFIAKEDGVPAHEVASSKGWDEIVPVLKMPRDIFSKAAIAAANTTDSAWAGPLVVYNNLQQEFIELLRPRTIIGRIPGLRNVPFNIKVPRETGETTGYWVGQGSPKPVSAGSLDSITLDFNKIAGITYLTQELLRFSQPSAENIMINSLTKAIIKLMDNDFLDPSKAVVTGVSPASITNTASSITASGTTADAFRADFGRLLATYTATNFTLDDMVIVMSQTQALRLALMRNDFGGRQFPDINKDGGFIEGIPVVTSENVASNGGSPADGRIIVALAANSILIADDGGVQIDISTEASIQTDSAPDSPTTSSTTLVSLWQNNLVGIRCERFVTWTKARSGAVAYITGGNYA